MSDPIRAVRRATFRNPTSAKLPPSSPTYSAFDILGDAEDAEDAAPVILASPPHDPLAIAAGYTVYAVQMDDAGEVITGQTVAGPGLRIGSASAIAHAAAFHPERYPFDANFVVVNDGTGKTFEKFPVLRVAA